MRTLGPDWELALVRDTHTFDSMTLVAATDYGHCYASLFEGNRVPVYGHLALARAALEACVVSLWLNHPRIVTEERLKRGLCEQLYSTREVLRLGLGDTAKAAENEAMWRTALPRLAGRWALTEQASPSSEAPGGPTSLNEYPSLSSAGETDHWEEHCGAICRP
jgi:hypothetical protein